MDEVTKALVNRVLGHEGGYVNDPADPGGETKWGISKAQYPTLDIKNLTREHAATIYERDYLKVTKIVQIPHAGLRAQVFDFAVNSGPPQAIRTLQRLLNVKADGLLGASTLHVLKHHPAPNALNNRLVNARIAFLDDLVEKRPRLARFQTGWRKRAASFRLPV